MTGDTFTPAFLRAFAIVVGEEGGFGATASDPGNWTGGAVGEGVLRGTKFGISAGEYPTLDIEHITLDDARAIYLRDYWSHVRGDDVPAPLALLVFDAAVNNSPARAVEWLQEAVGAAVDGVFGDKTLGAMNDAVAAHGGAWVCAEMLARRTDFMARLPTWGTFGLGWARRLCALPYKSLTMPGASASA